MDQGDETVRREAPGTPNRVLAPEIPRAADAVDEPVLGELGCFGQWPENGHAVQCRAPHRRVVVEEADAVVLPRWTRGIEVVHEIHDIDGIAAGAEDDQSLNAFHCRVR